MRRFSDDEIDEIQKDGGDVRTHSGGKYIKRPDKPAMQPAIIEAKQVEKPAESPKHNESQAEIIKAMIGVMQQTEKNTDAIVKVVEELLKPKPKRQMKSTVERDVKGIITVVYHKEL